MKALRLKQKGAQGAADVQLPQRILREPKKRVGIWQRAGLLDDINGTREIMAGRTGFLSHKTVNSW